MDLGAGQTEAGEHALLLEFDMDMAGFTSNWAYCDRLSTYFARMISHNRSDSLLYSNLFSSALNELLETVYRLHAPTGSFVCSVSRSGASDRIALTIPVDAETEQFYREAVVILNGGDVSPRYHKALFSDGPLQPNIGLLELAVDYAARFSIEPADGNAIRLIAELTLEASAP
ncbi:ubiquinone biosynthesis methyltransferase UbiE [Shinella sp.]|uniref:ubiquinone biosynthesis methyltransferase UbiE n=1 Tax=Shinella sp. TaxID=1870904 RepID=UPI003F710A03